MPSGFQNWSTTAASNATADSSINWAEGQSPSSVNDSARATMAALRAYGNDIAGSIATGGSSTAYTVTTGEAFTTLALMNGQMIAFTPHTTNGATVTLAVDGLAAKPLRYGPSLELQTGMLIQGTPYAVTYNNSDAVFYLRSFPANPYGVPLGGMMPYIGTTAPNSAFVLPFGQAINRTTYATLFSLVSTTFGVGDGSTTFNVPDLRGRSIFGLDNMGGSAASRITVAGGNFDGTALGTAGGAQNKTIAQANLPAATLATTITDPTHSHDLRGFTSLSGGAATSFNSSSAGATISGLGGTGIVPSSTGITASTALGGSGTALAILPPSMVLPFILRVI